MNFKLIWEPDGVVVRFTGDIRIDDLHAANLEFERDPRFAKSKYFIGDVTSIDSCTGKPEEINYVWALDYSARLINPRYEKGIVATDPTTLGWVEAYRLAGRGAHIYVFDTVDSARAYFLQ